MAAAMAREVASEGGAGAEKIRVGFIVGATGVGKTALAVRIAERIGAEIVNADSRQLYRRMDIGTAKPSAAERGRVPHHLIDVLSPEKVCEDAHADSSRAGFDVAAFVRIARAAISDITARGRRVLVVGGSGLYVRALKGGVFSGPAASKEIRARLEAIAAERGAGYLHERLREIDPAAANRIGYNDVYRITRAIEVFELTGETISAHQARHRFASRPYECLTVGLATKRDALYESVDRRFDAMLEAGLVDEVRGLLAAGCDPSRLPLATIGYKQIAEYLAGAITLEEAAVLAKRASRQFAKRQLTWFRADREVVWLDAARAFEQALELFLKFFAAPRSRAGAA